ncbi:MAG: GNAT family N-acetyltransferase [bacterium]
MALFRLEDPNNPAFRDFLESQLPYSLRFRGALEESSGEAPVWVDDPEGPRLALQGSDKWLTLLGKPADVLHRLDEIGALPAGPPEEEGRLRFGALPLPVRDALAARRDIVRETHCGLYTLREEDFTPFREGPEVDSLREEDAPALSSLSEYGATPAYCAERIRSAPSAAVRIGGELASSMLVHENGSIGMLHTREEFRNRRLGRLAASALAERQLARGKAVYCYIVDGNTPSQRVFQSLGFRRAAEVSWIVFERAEGGGGAGGGSEEK